MPKESIHKQIGRIRRPRVHITYEVETDGALKDVEIPFVVGVFADLSGQPDQPLPAIKDRKFVEIDRDNFDQVMAKMSPRLAFKVDNTLTNDDTKLGVELKFSNIEDFAPQNVAEQIDPLRKLLELRRKLYNLRSGLYGNERLETMLQDILHNTEALNKLRTELGLPEPGDQDGSSGRES